jgi:quercetin dioxygenase-like cupin family protein
MANSRRLPMARILAIASVAAVSPAMTVLGQTGHGAGDQVERRVVAQTRFAVTNAPLQAELVVLVVDFPPGAWTSVHTHGGQAVNLVLEGEITLRHPGMEHPHRAGQAWTDSAGQVHAAGNTGAGKARLLTNFLLSRWAPQITVLEDSKFEPTIVYEARAPVPPLPADTEIVQEVADLASGWRAKRTLVGFVASIVLDGEVTYQIGGDRKPYKAGEAWSAQPGALVMEENRTGSKARIFTTYLLPRGTDR